MVVEGGCTLHEARAAAAEAGRLLGIDHGGAGSSQIGGNLATNAGGNNVLRYGMGRDQVLWPEVVLADGGVPSRVSPLRRRNAGYDLKQIFLGSEGTLGLITAATLRLSPSAARRATALLGLSSPEKALALFVHARSVLGESISACELMSRGCVELYLQQSGKTRWPLTQHADWLLLLEADSASSYFDLEGAFHALLEGALTRKMVCDGTVAASEGQRREIRRMRDGIAEAMIATPGSLKSDTAVPIAAIGEFVNRAAAAVAAIVPQCRPMPFGHLGDGNIIHFNVLPPAGADGVAFEAKWPDLAAAIADVSLSLGGAVSAEHGTGMLKRCELRQMLSPEEQMLMRRLKPVLDSQRILNPGKIDER